MTSAVLRAVYPNIAKYVDGISKEKSVKAACEVMERSQSACRRAGSSVVPGTAGGTGFGSASSSGGQRRAGAGRRAAPKKKQPTTRRVRLYDAGEAPVGSSQTYTFTDRSPWQRKERPKVRRETRAFRVVSAGKLQSTLNFSPRLADLLANAVSLPVS